MERKRHDIETDVKLGPFHFTLHADRSGWLNLHVVSFLDENRARSAMLTGHKCKHPVDERDDPYGMKLPTVDNDGIASGYFHHYPWYWSFTAKVR